MRRRSKRSARCRATVRKNRRPTVNSDEIPGPIAVFRHARFQASKARDWGLADALTLIVSGRLDKARATEPQRFGSSSSTARIQEIV